MIDGMTRMLAVAATETEPSLWAVGPFELAMMIAGGIITVGMIVAFVVIFLRKDDQAVEDGGR